MIKGHILLIIVKLASHKTKTETSKFRRELRNSLTMIVEDLIKTNLSHHNTNRQGTTWEQRKPVLRGEIFIQDMDLNEASAPPVHSRQDYATFLFVCFEEGGGGYQRFLFVQIMRHKKVEIWNFSHFLLLFFLSSSIFLSAFNFFTHCDVYRF